MKYLLTYAAIDGEYGNPFWHSYLMLSQLEENKKIQVVDTWGFYGLPSTDRSSCLSKFKIKLRLDVDLTGNHGMLRHEDLRYLDTGKGLHGVTFELSEEKFAALQKKCQLMAANQEKAIKEVVETQDIKGISENKFRIYPYEKYSRVIFDLEKIKAEQHNREPRLKPFEFNINVTPKGLTLRQSHTCKSQILSLLKGILTEQQINRLTENNKHPTLPIYSGPMENIYLHSNGPLREHKKSTGEITYYRDMKDPGVELHWTLPPQEIETKDPTTETLLKINPDYCHEAKILIQKLQQLYWLFTNAPIPEKYKDQQINLLNLIKDHYEAFAIVGNLKPNVPLPSWKARAFSLFLIPKNESEKRLLNNIKNGKALINSLYMATIDRWEMADDTSPTPEALASYLNIKDKKTLCKIIDRNFIEPEKDILTTYSKVSY